ncbi:MAG: hypothetical protein AB7D51_12945 [Desulfovibrionaceae bacterium]
MQCAVCEHAAPEGASFCPACGARLPGGSPPRALPRRPGRGARHWSWVALLVLAVPAGLGLAFWLYLNAPARAVRAHLDALRAGDLEAAYARTSGAFQSIINRKAFREMVESNNAMRDMHERTVEHISRYGDRAEVVALVEGGEGNPQRGRYVVFKMDGQWRIHLITSP